MASVLVVLSLRRESELDWVRGILKKHEKDRVRLVVDRKTAEILARHRVVLSSESNLLVFAGRKPEEFALKVYKISTPDIAYVCDKYNVLGVIVDLLRSAPTKIVEC